MKNQKSIIKYFLCLFCFILCGCITEYEVTDIDEIADILVVEGIITDDITYITLSRSKSLTDWEKEQTSVQYVYNATVYVECDDDTRLAGYPDYTDVNNIRYIINTGKLNLERQYRLKIEIEECDVGVDYYRSSITCSLKTYEYRSNYSYPMQTPVIDSVFWSKRGRGQPVMIYIATHDPSGKSLHYRWSYKEDWEFPSEVFLQKYPYYCWNKASSKVLLIGNAEKTVFGKVTDMITEMSPWSEKLSLLYRIDVNQNLISKRAYDYFANIKKNAELSGSIFAPVPSELRGNITCITNPEKPVIGYIDVSTTTKKRRYIYYNEGAYEQPRRNKDCDIVPLDSLLKWYNKIPDEYVIYDSGFGRPTTYIMEKCVNCTINDGTMQKPEDWPNDH